MAERVDFELFLVAWLYVLGPTILLIIFALLAFFALRRLYRYYSIPAAVREEEHRRWEVGRIKEWIRVRKEVLDRGWESLGYSIGTDRAEVEEMYRLDERLGELKARLRELEGVEERGLMGDLEGGEGRREI